MSLVLIVEDEAMLRTSLARGISKMPGVEVSEAGSVDEALTIMDDRAPDLIVSDIDMPGRTGIELLGELASRDISIPIIYASAYLKAYGVQIPPNANIEVLEKPVALDEIRGLIRAKLDDGTGGSSTLFGVPLAVVESQLASLGGGSTAIDVRWPDGSSGQITVHDGEVWDAQAGTLSGVEAFDRIMWREGGSVRCRPLVEPGPRTVTGPTESLLMDSVARSHNETAGHDAVPETAEPETPPPATPGPRMLQASFERLVDDGVGALLAKDYAAALVAFVAADALLPGDAVVRANLGRLAEMGFGGGGEK